MRQEVRDKLTKHEDTCSREKGRLEVELRMAQETLKKSTQFTMGTSYSGGGGGLSASKKDCPPSPGVGNSLEPDLSGSVSEENNRLKLELAESTKQRCIERWVQIQTLLKVDADSNSLSTLNIDKQLISSLV